MTEPKIRSWIRSHGNGLFGLISSYEYPENQIVYSAGTVPGDSVGSLQYGLGTFEAAKRYADDEAANHHRHQCNADCGAWTPPI